MNSRWYDNVIGTMRNSYKKTYFRIKHYTDVTMSPMASQITSLGIVYSSVYSGADQRKHQSSASLAFVRGIHRGPVNSPRKRPVTRKMFPFDDVIMFRGKVGRSLYPRAPLCSTKATSPAACYSRNTWQTRTSTSRQNLPYVSMM